MNNKTKYKDLMFNLRARARDERYNISFLTKILKTMIWLSISWVALCGFWLFYWRFWAHTLKKHLSMDQLKVLKLGQYQICTCVILPSVIGYNFNWY